MVTKVNRSWNFHGVDWAVQITACYHGSAGSTQMEIAIGADDNKRIALRSVGSSSGGLTKISNYCVVRWQRLDHLEYSGWAAATPTRLQRERRASIIEATA